MKLILYFESHEIENAIHPLSDRIMENNHQQNIITNILPLPLYHVKSFFSKGGMSLKCKKEKFTEGTGL